MINSASGCVRAFAKCGKKQGPTTLREALQFVACFQQYISLKKDRQVRSNRALGAIHHALDNCFRQLQSEGVGTTSKQADVDEEEQLRKK